MKANLVFLIILLYGLNLQASENVSSTILEKALNRFALSKLKTIDILQRFFSSRKDVKESKVWRNGIVISCITAKRMTKKFFFNLKL